MKLRGLNDDENLVYIYIMNTHSARTTILKYKYDPFDVTLIALNDIFKGQIYPRMEDKINKFNISLSVVFAHVVMNARYDLHPSVIKHLETLSVNWDETEDVVKAEPALGPGCPVNHLNSSLYFCNDAVIISEDAQSSARWYVSYTNEAGNKVQGHWLKIRCVYRAPSIPEPETSHITDPVCNKLTILDKSEEEPMSTITHITQINDRDVKEMSSGEILSAIGNAEARLEKLQKHKDKSKFVTQERKRLKDFVKEAYNILDDQFAQ